MPATIEAPAFAVIDERGAIEVRSVSHSRIGAIVNFLVTNRGIRMPDVSDQRVEAAWAQHARGAVVTAVTVTAPVRKQ